MEKSLAETLKCADPELLQEILREAESRLNSQLTTAIAADTRAMTFLGFLSAIAVATVGTGLAAYASTPNLSILALFTGLGFTCAAYYAFEAAHPIDFEMVGNDPGSWKRDIENGVKLHDALAEQVAFYDEMLKSNREAMAESSAALNKSANVAMATVAISAAFAVVYVAGIIPRT